MTISLFGRPRIAAGFFSAAITLFAAGCNDDNDHHDEPARPNVLFILADDLGYSDIGAYGGEIHTPNLDTLAAEGRLLMQHYSGRTCAPTRAMLMAGTDQHVTGISEQGSVAGSVLDYQKGKPGYEGYLNQRSLVLPQLLRDAGYHTYMAGKWNLGAEATQRPNARGFESSFALLNAYGYHWGRRGDSVLPAQDDSFIYTENDTPVTPPADFFSTDYFTDKLIQFIDQPRSDGQPFFAYAAYTAPHWPLLASDDFIDRYKGQYDVGYTVIRERRLARQKQLGLLPAALAPATLRPDSELPEWDQLSAADKQDQARRMEVYAAMVEQLDYNVGRLIQHLKQTGQYDNTLIWFQSDNGAEGSSSGIAQSKDARYDNSLANYGRYGSFITYGSRWAEVSSTPLWLWKFTPAEGGISVPAIVRMPHQASARQPLQQITSVQDVLPTLLELAGAPNPGSTYKGAAVNPITGYSVLPVLQEKPQAIVRPQGTVLAGEQSNQRFVHKDGWKLVRLNPPYGSGGWQLFNIAEDRAEKADVAASNPDKVAELVGEWDAYVTRFGVALPPESSDASTASAAEAPGETTR